MDKSTRQTKRTCTCSKKKFPKPTLQIIHGTTLNYELGGGGGEVGGENDEWEGGEGGHYIYI